MSLKKRRTYNEDFKKQIVSLFESGKSPIDDNIRMYISDRLRMYKSVII